ncbi:c-type cytochrome [Flavobacterium croceum]|uniref:Cytochrome c n=1 Tax=Flavobacterium croceum DSM 17960 TaxID=1121886 RepID=A0A2S4NBE3_9FLAO|nr:c-type cytochrome [Flavobacterium croceum]POS03034.1 cytochrome c [Flavobacterium croceum DSM 17960]
MKTFLKSFLLVLVVSLMSCGGKKEEQDFGKKTESSSNTEKKLSAEAEMGKTIFEGKGTCATCHKPDTKLVGPSVKDISKIYTDKKASIVTFLKGEAEPIVDPTQYEVMKANFAITKNMTDEELKALEAYIHSVE